MPDVSRGDVFVANSNRYKVLRWEEGGPWW
jgi:hypothetical protein